MHVTCLGVTCLGITWLGVICLGVRIQPMIRGVIVKSLGCSLAGPIFLFRLLRVGPLRASRLVEVRAPATSR